MAHTCLTPNEKVCRRRQKFIKVTISRIGFPLTQKSVDQQHPSEGMIKYFLSTLKFSQFQHKPFLNYKLTTYVISATM